MCAFVARENTDLKETRMKPNAFPNRHFYRPGVTTRCGKDSKGLLAILMGFIILFLTPAFSHPAEGVPNLPPDIVASKDPIFDDSVSSGIHLVLHDRFREGLRVFEDLGQTYPDHPAPHFFKAATYQSWMAHFRLKRFQKEFEENIRLAIHKGNALLKHENNPWLLFYVGAAYGYRAFNHFRKHKWISAYSDATMGVDHLEKALKRDPKLFDVYLGLGSYYYWRTAKSRFLRLITFWIPDKRELGLRQLEFSFERGSYAPDQAGYNLIAAYFDYGQYEKALHSLNRVLEKKKRPGITDLYYRGRLLIKSERWPEAETGFREILERLENHQYASTGYKTECMYWIAETLRAQKKRAEALKFTEMALALSEERDAGSELEGPFESFREIESRLERLHQYLKGEEVDYW
jgi:tetratricopeptide (TPR) repeat protein